MTDDIYVGIFAYFSLKYDIEGANINLCANTNSHMCKNEESKIK